MARQLLTALVIAACAAVAVSSCSSSGGTHVQSVPPTTSAASDPSTPSPSTPVTANPTTGTPVTTGFGAAQAAVNAYLGWMAQLSSGLMSPSRFVPATATKFAAGQAKLVLTGAVADELKHGNAWRGKPWASRIDVTASNLTGSLPQVVMTDCALPNSSWTEYVVKTGHAVPTSTPKVAPPYLATIKAFQPNRKSWVITSYTLNASKTCTR